MVVYVCMCLCIYTCGVVWLYVCVYMYAVCHCIPVSSIDPLHYGASQVSTAEMLPWVDHSASERKGVTVKATKDKLDEQRDKRENYYLFNVISISRKTWLQCFEGFMGQGGSF